MVEALRGSRHRKVKTSRRRVDGQRLETKREWSLKDTGLMAILCTLFVGVFGFALWRDAKPDLTARIATVLPVQHAQAPSWSTQESANRTAELIQGRVVGVTDGDTITVLDDRRLQHTVRLAEIDAPERGQPWGNRARQTLSSMVAGQTVTVRPTDTDRYGRTVGRVYIDDRDVAHALIAAGAAWAFRRYLTDQSLVEVEQRARDQRVGLWSMSAEETVAPWDWRRGVRRGGASSASATANGNLPQGLMTRPRAETLHSNGVMDAQGFGCRGKRVCRQMTSCAEAHFYLTQCGVSSLDGNSDGEPCEVLCGTAGRTALN